MGSGGTEFVALGGLTSAVQGTEGEVEVEREEGCWARIRSCAWFCGLGTGRGEGVRDRVPTPELPPRVRVSAMAGTRHPLVCSHLRQRRDWR
jgi:hypothetical protein